MAAFLSHPDFALRIDLDVLHDALSHSCDRHRQGAANVFGAGVTLENFGQQIGKTPECAHQKSCSRRLQYWRLAPV